MFTMIPNVYATQTLNYFRVVGQVVLEGITTITGVLNVTASTFFTGGVSFFNSVVFTILPTSTAIPTNAADLTNKAYVDGEFVDLLASSTNVWSGRTHSFDVPSGNDVGLPTTLGYNRELHTTVQDEMHFFIV